MAGPIPRERLVKGCWYVGRGRNANVGLWDGTCFLVIGEKFGQPVIKGEAYYTETEGCFQPFRAIDEGKMIEPFGATGWDAHYGRKMEFASDNVSTGELSDEPDS